MSADLIQSIQAISSIGTPVIILYLGVKINKTLAAYKAALDKDKEWRTEWAKRFYSASADYNSSAEDLVATFFITGQLYSQKPTNWEKKTKEKWERINSIIEEIHRAECSLKISVEFATISKDKVLTSSQKILSQMNKLLTEKKGAKRDDLLVSLSEFNKAAMMAHRERLG